MTAQPRTDWAGSVTAPLARGSTVVALTVIATWMLAVTERSTRLTLLGVVGFTGLIVLITLFGRPGYQRLAVPLGLLAMYTAIPIIRVEASVVRALVVACTLGLLALLLLLRSVPRGAPLLALLCLVIGLVTLVDRGTEAALPVLLVTVPMLTAHVAAGQLLPAERPLLGHAVIGVAVSQALYAIAEPWLPWDKLWAAAKVGDDGAPIPMANELLGQGLERSQATLGHALPLGFLLLVGVCFAIRIERFRLRWPVLLVLLAGSALAGARLSLGLAIVIIVVLGPRPGDRLTSLLAKLPLLAAAAALAFVVLDLAVAVQNLQASGSWQHRLESATSTQRLLLWQEVPQVVFGNGVGATSRAYAGGLLTSDGLNAIDNQYILTLYQGGLLALIILIGVLGRALVRADVLLRPAMIAVVVTMSAFDLVQWPASAVLAFLVVGMATTTDHQDRALSPPHI